MSRCATLALLAALTGPARAALAQQDAPSQFMEGERYRIGMGVPSDQVKAREWYLKAAAQGHIVAQFYLGYSYLSGVGVAVDSVAGYQWLYLASTRNPENKDYRERLAYLEARIRGVLMARGKVLALEWLKRRGE